MKSTFLSCLTALAVLLAAPAAQAAAWTPPAQVKIVQPGAEDRPRVYNSIQNAVGSITDASPTKRYLVKVMPGTWTVPANTTLTMKAYVDVEGSGKENTVIVGSNANVNDACTMGVVTMANDMTLRNIKVVNNVPVVNAMQHANGIVFNDVRARVEDVKVVVGSDTVVGGRNNGVFGCGGSSDVTLDHVDIETRNLGEMQSNPVMLGGPAPAGMGASLTVRNSVLSAKMIGLGCSHGINDDSSAPGRVTVTNTAITVDSPCAYGLFLGPHASRVENSTVALTNGANYCMAIWAAGSNVFTNVQLSASTASTCGYFIGDAPFDVNRQPTTKVVHSQLPGDLSGLAPALLLGNYDAGFVAIPDQHPVGPQP